MPRRCSCCYPARIDGSAAALTPTGVARSSPIFIFLHVPCVALSPQQTQRDRHDIYPEFLRGRCARSFFVVFVAFINREYGASVQQKRQPRTGLPLCETPRLRSLKLLDHPHVPEPPDVIIETARVADRVTKLDSLRVWRRLIEDVAHTNGEGGIVEDILPARHHIRNRRRLLLLACHFLAALRIPRHRRCFHRRCEDQGVRELCIYKVSRMHKVVLIETIQPDGEKLFIVSIQEMPGPVHVPV